MLFVQFVLAPAERARLFLVIKYQMKFRAQQLSLVRPPPDGAGLVLGLITALFPTMNIHSQECTLSAADRKLGLFPRGVRIVRPTTSKFSSFTTRLLPRGYSEVEPRFQEWATHRPHTRVVGQKHCKRPEHAVQSHPTPMLVFLNKRLIGDPTLPIVLGPPPHKRYSSHPSKHSHQFSRKKSTPRTCGTRLNPSRLS